MDAIRRKRDISTAWTTFVLDKSDGFTQAGVTRPNDSIRTYERKLRHMFGQSWDRKLRHVQISLALERDLTPKTILGECSRLDFLAHRHPKQHRSLSENSAVRIHTIGFRVRDWALPVTERQGTLPRQCTGVQ